MADEKNCPDCGTSMEPGFIEGTYLTWSTKPRGWRTVARVMTSGLAATAAPLGKGLWPSRLAAFQCPSCGTGCW